jgi:hypothetical protein
MTQDGGEDAIRVFGIDQNAGDLLAVPQPEMRPGLAAVGGFEQTGPGPT